MVSAGYSGTTLAEKLGIKPATKILALNAPKDYRALLAPLPDGVSFLIKPPESGTGFVHLFVASLAQLDRDLPRARRAMTQDGRCRSPGTRRRRRFRPTSARTQSARERLGSISSM